MTREENSLATLLQQAFQIKEDMLSSLHVTQGSVLMEASARKLLQNHIQTITHIVKQLSKDIQVLEAQIVQRDSVASGTSFAVQRLDHKNLTGIGDLRGRVARCDAGIAKLSGDVKTGEQEIMKLQKKVGEMRSVIELQLRDMEFKENAQSEAWGWISDGLGCHILAFPWPNTWSLRSLEASQLEQITSLKNMTVNIQRDIQQLETRMSSGLKEVEEEAACLRKWTEQQLSSTVKAHTDCSQQMHLLLQDKVEDLEVKLKTQVDLLFDHVGHVEKQLEKERTADWVKQFESKLSSRINNLEKSFKDELEQIKREYQSGFQSAMDAIASLRDIADTKAKLDKGELKKDIRQIQRKMAALPATDL
ncbi:protein FAM81B-like [Hoplias malabaricus]|uniref:protein FAM81B-like n=1 Tax=Hoplias malabaricus TaxID=27720 RepID=UPI003461EA45